MKLTIAHILTVVAGLSLAALGVNALQATSSSTATTVEPPSLVAMGKASVLAKELQGKPVVVDIYASWCPACQNVAPTLSQLKQQYGEKVHFVVLDVTDRTTTANSVKLAAKLGLTTYFNNNKSQTGAIAIIDPASGDIKKQFRNNTDLAAYSSEIDSSIAQMSRAGGDAMKKP